jgi:hypothetical protein
MVIFGVSRACTGDARVPATAVFMRQVRILPGA